MLSTSCTCRTFPSDSNLMIEKARLLCLAFLYSLLGVNFHHKYSNTFSYYNSVFNISLEAKFNDSTIRFRKSKSCSISPRDLLYFCSIYSRPNALGNISPRGHPSAPYLLIYGVYKSVLLTVFKNQREVINK